MQKNVLFRFERKFVQDLRQQQDEAYEQSLRADQEKERQKQLERERLLQQEQEQEAEILEKQRQKEVKIFSSVRNNEKGDNSLLTLANQKEKQNKIVKESL